MHAVGISKWSYKEDRQTRLRGGARNTNGYECPFDVDDIWCHCLLGHEHGTQESENCVDIAEKTGYAHIDVSSHDAHDIVLS